MKDQADKSEAHIALQPKSLEKNSVQHIMLYDIAGYGTNEIAEALEMTPGRISIIKGSPLYRQQRNQKFDELKSKMVDGTVNKILEDPVRKVLAEAKLECAEQKVELALRGKSEFVRSAACSEILAIGGVIPQRQNDKAGAVTVVMEERLAKRFGFAKDYKEELVERKVTITENAA